MSENDPAAGAGAGLPEPPPEPVREPTPPPPDGFEPVSPGEQVRDVVVGPSEAAPEWQDPDPYLDVPASLELSYTTTDMGLSEGAWGRAFPYDEAEDRRRRRSAGSRARRFGREVVETLILALLIFFAVKAMVQNFRVEGESMEPSLHDGQYVIVNKAIFFRFNMDRVHDVLPFVPGDDGRERHVFRAPRRGDVIVFRYPLDPRRDFIKRVIGIPGDTVEVHDGSVFINGNPLEENYIEDTPNYTYGPKTVPDGHYFVLGDNRRNSSDSSKWGGNCTSQQQCDFVPEENIIGQAWVLYWPLDSLDFVNNKVLKPQAQ
ncbi:MAG: signal peptidase I [Dehalococcoidia bacterium]